MKSYVSGFARGCTLFIFSFVCIGFVGGCGDGSNAVSAPAQISPDQEKKTSEMLQNYGKMQADMHKGKAKK